MAQPNTYIDAAITYGDYAQWPEGERWELIDGVAYDMTPAPVTSHHRILARLFKQFADFLDGKQCEAFFAPIDLLLPEDEEADERVRTVVQPDLLVVCDPAKVTKKGVRGAPDLVVEILSPSTARKDQVSKLDLYERHGVREYWIIHPEDRFVTIYLMDDAKRQYGRPLLREAAGRQAVHILPELEIDLEAIFTGPAEASPSEGDPI